MLGILFLILLACFILFLVTDVIIAVELVRKCRTRSFWSIGIAVVVLSISLGFCWQVLKPSEGLTCLAVILTAAPLIRLVRLIVKGQQMSNLNFTLLLMLSSLISLYFFAGLCGLFYFYPHYPH